MHVVVVAGDSGVDLSSNTVGGQGQSGEAIKLFQAPRKISFPSIFNTSLSSLMTWNLQSYPPKNSFEWKNVTVLGGGGCGKNTLSSSSSSIYFSNTAKQYIWKWLVDNIAV